MLADIVVFKPADPKKHFFTYKIPDRLRPQIKLGQLVEVPWGRQSTTGIIIEIKNYSEIDNLKDITAISSLFIFLLPHQIKLLKWMSNYYFAPMLDCAKAMLPFTGKWQMANGRWFSQINTRHTLYATRYKQTIVLVPTINQIPQILASQRPKPKNPIIYHHELKPKNLIENWLRIYQGQADFIIGPRSTIFAPCPNLSQITIYDEEQNQYKDQRSPYYHCVDIVFKLSELTNAKVTLESHAPRVETVYRLLGNLAVKSLGNKMIKKNNIRLNFLTNPSYAKASAGKQTFQIIDMANERRLKNFGILSDLLRNSLIQKNNKHENVLLFLNRITEAGNIYCKTCQHATSVDSEPEVCPNCTSPTISYFSLNLKTLAKEIKSFMPNANIDFVTEERSELTPKSPITIATSSILTSLATQKYSLVAVVSADTSLNLPDYQSAQNTYQLLTQIKRFALKKQADMVIQTFNPNHYAIKSAISGDYSSFYNQEIKSRYGLDYPPFGILAKLVHTTKRHQVDEKADQLARLIGNKIKAEKLNVEVLGPTAYKLPKKSTSTIILKGRERESLDVLLDLVPSNWQIIIDPKDTL